MNKEEYAEISNLLEEKLDKGLCKKLKGHYYNHTRIKINSCFCSKQQREDFLEFIKNWLNNIQIDE